MTILSMTCSKSVKWLLCFFDLFEVSKMTNYYDLIKVSKMSNYYDLINKAIQGTFFKSQKSKNRLKSHRFLFTCEKQWQIVKKK